MTRRDVFDRVRHLHGGGMSQQAIANQTGMHRSTVQRLIWLADLPDYTQTAFLAGSLPESKIHELWKVRHSPEAWRHAYCEMRLDERVADSRVKTRGEIRLAMQATKSKRVREVLLWVLGERDEL